ncbi:MAG: shikimate dehydrogenase [Verrucomicrobiota bacterium]
MFEPGLKPISATTRYCAVFGHPIRHSASPAMQNTGIAGLGLNWRYLAFDVEPSQLRAAIQGAQAMKFIGLNLTVPHKILAMDMVDELDQSARHWGAVNTIVFEGRTKDGEWKRLRELEPDAIEATRSVGFNTDADAIARSIEEDLKLKLAGAKVLLLGVGGAGRVAALKLAECGVGEMHLVNRTMQKAEDVSVEIRQRCPEVTVRIGYPASGVDLILNGTSLGLKPDDPMPMDLNQFFLAQARCVYDMIYRPPETPLLRAARKAGCRVANGFGMLLYQGARALELWSGETAPVDLMRQALEKHIYA